MLEKIFRINNIKKIRLNLKSKTLFVLASLLFSGFLFLSFRWVNFREEKEQMLVIREKKDQMVKEKVRVELKYEKDISLGEEFVLGIKMGENNLDIEALELELEINEEGVEYLGIEENEELIVTGNDEVINFEEEKSYALGKFEQGGKLRIAVFNLRQKKLANRKGEILQIRFRKKSEVEASISLSQSERNMALLRENGEVKKVEEI